MKKTFCMGEAMELFESLKGELIHSHVENAHLGAMGATKVQIWTSKDGGTLHYKMSNGGCTLIVEPTE